MEEFVRSQLVMITVAFALLATACATGDVDAEGGVASLGSDGVADATETGDETTLDLTEEEVALAFTECLREEGLAVDDPTVDSDGNVRPPRLRQIAAASEGMTREELDAVREACLPLLEGFTFGFQNVDQTEREDRLLEFAACMRDNGYDLPDPDLSGTPGSGGGPFGGAIDPNDPAFQTAASVCAELFGGFGGGQTGPGTGRGGDGE
jgi:hypothetical protein